MAYQETVAGWRFIIELSGANWGAAKGEHYISAVNTAIDELEKKINAYTGVLSDPSRLKGFIAEDWHAGTFNIEAILRGSQDRVYVVGSNAHASVDVSSSWGQGFSMKFYATAQDSALSQAKDVYQAYYEYLRKSKSDTPMTFEQYLAHNGYSGDLAELLRSVYHGQGRIIPLDQLEEARRFLQQKIASESMKDGANRAAVLAKYEETLSQLSDRIKNNQGVESIPLTKEEAEAIAALCKEGKFDPRDFGLSLESLVTTEYILQQALKAGCTAALLTVIFQIAPYIYNAFMRLVKDGKIDLEALKEGAQKAIPATAEGFLRGAIASALTVAAQSGKLGPAFINIDAGVIGAITFLALDSVKNSILVVAGKMTPKEMGCIFAEQAFLAGGSIAGGIAGQTLLPTLPVLGYMMGSLAGSLIASSVILVGKKMLLAFCIDSGFTCFGLVEQNYELPSELLERMEYEVAQYEAIHYESVRYNTIDYSTIEYDNIEYTYTRYAEGFEFIPLRRGIIGFNKIGYVY